MLTVVANVRRSTEFRVANDYTYRQLMHIVATYVKDKFLVFNEIAKALGGEPSKKPPARGGVSAQAKKKPQGPGQRKLPSWYKPTFRYDERGRRVRRFNRVVDLDGPMQTLTPYLGRGKINRKVKR